MSKFSIVAANKIAGMITKIPACVKDLIIIQRKYNRGFVSYKEVEKEVEYHFGSLARGLLFFNMNAGLLDDDYDYESNDANDAIESVVIILTQGCLSGDWEEIEE